MKTHDVQSGSAPRIDLAPRSLHPEAATATLPSASVYDLRRLRAQGWMRFGLVAAIVDPNKRIMMLEHHASSKTPAGTLGPLAETAQVGMVQGLMVPESTEDTLARALREELGQLNPSQVELQACKLGSWELYSWPVGINHGDQRAFAVCPVVHVSSDERQRLEDEFTGTEEIRSVHFMSPDNIDRHNNIRLGTEGWLGVVAASQLMDIPPEESTGLILPISTGLPEAVDARLQEITL